MKYVEMVMQRDCVHRSTLGHNVKFTKGEPTSVPAVCVEEVMLKGAVPTDLTDLEVEEKVENPAPVGPDRVLAIFSIFDKLVELNDRDSFTAGGRPKQDAVVTAFGHRIDAREITDLWTQYSDKSED